jgi:hypothetical protein
MENRSQQVDYQQVGQLFDVVVEYFHDKPPPEEHDGKGEWVRVRDGLQGAEHCIRVLTPDEFEEWHRCVDLPIQVEQRRRPVAFCSHEGEWWVVYSDTDESEVIAWLEKCLEGVPASEDSAATGPELSRFKDIVVTLPVSNLPPSHFVAASNGERAEFSIVSPRMLKGSMSPEVAGLVTKWAALHERELLQAWEDHVAGEEPSKIEGLS